MYFYKIGSWAHELTTDLYSATQAIHLNAKSGGQLWNIKEKTVKVMGHNEFSRLVSNNQQMIYLFTVGVLLRKRYSTH